MFSGLGEEKINFLAFVFNKFSGLGGFEGNGQNVTMKLGGFLRSKNNAMVSLFAPGAGRAILPLDGAETGKNPYLPILAYFNPFVKRKKCHCRPVAFLRPE